jgi:uncharacterized protein YegJ (DUF2314 family)
MSGRVTILAAAIIAIAGLSSQPCTAQSVLEKSKSGETASVQTGDSDMRAAMRKARATLPDFLALARGPQPGMSGFALKVGIPYGENNTEYLWVSPFEPRGALFVGRVNNTPVSVKNIKYRQMIEFDESNIADWMYRHDGKMKGNHTACALLKRDTPANREAFRKEYGLECD